MGGAKRLHTAAPNAPHRTALLNHSIRSASMPTVRWSTQRQRHAQCKRGYDQIPFVFYRVESVTRLTPDDLRSRAAC